MALQSVTTFPLPPASLRSASPTACATGESGGTRTTAMARLTPLVHQELRRMARRCLRGERAGHSLQATALVHEAYLRLVDVQHVNWHNRAHFLAMAARLMRRVLVDAARAQRSQKRGGGVLPVSLSDARGHPEKGEDVVA